MRKVLLTSAVSVILAFSAVFSAAAPVGAAALTDIAAQVAAPVVHTDGINPVEH